MNSQITSRLNVVNATQPDAHREAAIDAAPAFSSAKSGKGIDGMHGRPNTFEVQRQLNAKATTRLFDYVRGSSARNEIFHSPLQWKGGRRGVETALSGTLYNHRGEVQVGSGSMDDFRLLLKIDPSGTVTYHNGLSSHDPQVQNMANAVISTLEARRDLPSYASVQMGGALPTYEDVMNRRPPAE